ncbi:MAG: GTPase HflX [Candidatus Melainabacteria bacterium]|nr:GTPase HflX [Candidatus Melainabacteria bacterium]
MHGKVDLAKSKGLKKSEIRQLNRLLTQRIPADKILTIELADSVAELSNSIGQPVSLVVNRRGQVVNVTVGQPSDVNMPELRGVRVGPGRLCGHRIIHTHLSKATSGEVKTGQGPNKESLQCLARNRLDLLAQIEVNPHGTFSRSRGEQAKMADVIHIAHLLPGRDSEGKIWKLLEPETARRAQEENFEALITALEDEFRKVAPGLPVAEGEERAVLVGLVTDGENSWQVEDDLDELAQLGRTAGATICERLTQTRPQPDPRYFLGSGKVQELALMVQEMGANLVIVDQELTANQQRTLEEVVGVKVIDRTELILDIFAQRAQTREGKLQVELAQLKYLLPRLIGKGLTLSRLGGGIATRGPGETKLEIDRRRIRDRINSLEKETERIRSHRDTQRRRRNDDNYPVVALTGYTNSGKSTLLNALTKSNANVEDKLFATLDPTTRRTTLPDHSPVLLTDTVGFIKKLPTSLVAAFRATLEEVAVADVLIHVVDASHPNVSEHIASVYDVLSELGAVDKPLITVLNKADIVRKEDLTYLLAQVPNPVIISATKRVGLGSLLTTIQDVLQEVCPTRQKFSA